MASLERQSRRQRRRLTASPLAASLLALALGFGVATAHADDDALPKIPSKTPLKVGFAQTESNNP
ncbi:MAG: sugar ABC transporter substrate-binding protein, partial [Paraburkholderia sp.]